MDSLLIAVPAGTYDAIVAFLVACLAAAVGYGIGAINPAAIIARVRGIDLRAVGSGNPGATNAGRAFGWKVGVLVGVLDGLKGLLPVLAFELLGFPEAGLVAGLAAVLGHVTSPFLRGRGGKGVATSLGAILAVQPIWVLPVLAAFGVGYALTRRVGLSSVAAAVMLVPAAIWKHTTDAQIWFAIALTVLVLVRHRKNLLAALRR
ncbi:MAG TPA: glycerol-3-phosphate 1-O-acyltransferase PlsY [Candidatus Nanopelagicales bacterium]|nr:glycerol-3-phosphate 1-O-acyltransferase PlsY [Candidatus Nanopelagicales bacterium]